MRYLILLVVCCSALIPIFAQSTIVSGTVRDQNSRETLIGAYLSSGAGFRTVTDAEGRFSLTVKDLDTATITVTYLGYRILKQRVPARKDTVVSLWLQPASSTITTVEVTAARNYVVPRTEGSVARLSAETIKNLPRFLGETDPLRALQLLPGVQYGAEGSSALFVRGGSPDQNLILVDNIPLYSPTHLGGFFSIIDPEAINAITLYKGGFPARYSGRLSSIVDIRLKRGSPEKWSRTFAIGVLSSKLAVSGPVLRDKLTVSAVVRRSNLDLPMQASRLFRGSDNFFAGFFFYDATVKANYRLTDTDELVLSAYSGSDKLFVDQNTLSDEAIRDVSRQQSSLGTQWGNQAIGLQWNRTPSARLRTNYALAYTRYRYQDEFSGTIDPEDPIEPGMSFDNRLSSGIGDWSLRLHHELNAGHTYRFGLTANLPTYRQPRIILRRSEEGQPEEVQDTGERVATTFQGGVFLEWEPDLPGPWEMNLGAYTGAIGTENLLLPTFQPRFSASYRLEDHYILFTHYARMVQPLHLLSNSGTGPPTDLWLPATARVRPGRSDQFSLGGRYDRGRWLVEAEAFYKSLGRQIDFRDGASFFAGGGDWQDRVSTGGRGSVVGTELLVKYTTPKVQAWAAYTLSRNRRTFTDLNDGRSFPYRFDRPHMLSLVGMWQPKRKFNASISWTLESGNAITLPSATYEVEALDRIDASASDAFFPPIRFGPQTAYLYASRNNARLPTYHRLDLNVDFIKYITKKGRERKRTTSLGLYNAYNRYNPYFVFYDRAPDGGQQLQSLTLFPVVPYISYTSTL
jgi:hypothetical protein